MWNRLILTICSVFVLTGSASAGDMTHAPDRDFNTLSAAGNQHPQGIWSNGTTMWVVDDYNKKIYAYSLRSKNRASYRDIALTAGNQGAQGIWSDGTTVWVADDAGDRIYAYSLRSKNRDSDRDFNTLSAAGNQYPQGIWSNGTTIWVADFDDDKIYAYNLRSKNRDSDRDITLAAGNQHPQEIWSDGTTMWVVDSDDDKIYAYNLRSKNRDSDRDIALVVRNDNPQGIWSDGMTMWVTDRDDDKIYAYGGLAVTSDQGRWSDQGIRDCPMQIRGTTGSLKICVRDHECEDGDKIRVDVDDRSIFSGEIDNDWDCYTLDVWAGQSYAVELTALNGTGYKGDCSYADSNTGEIRVTGENTETQVWRHRGGTGSKARIIVETVR